MATGDVDREPELVEALGVPGGQLAQRRLQHPLIQAHDQIARLGVGDERLRLAQPVLRALPAQQRLDAVPSARARVGDRLVVEVQSGAAGVQGAGQVALDRRALQQGLLQARVIELDLPASG